MKDIGRFVRFLLPFFRVHMARLIVNFAHAPCLFDRHLYSVLAPLNCRTVVAHGYSTESRDGDRDVVAGIVLYMPCNSAVEQRKFVLGKPQPDMEVFGKRTKKASHKKRGEGPAQTDEVILMSINRSR